MIVAELAAAVAAQVCAGRRVVLVVGTAVHAEEYKRAIEYLELQSTHVVFRGAVTVLVADADNGSDWKKERFDACEVCPSAEGHEGAGELAAEAALRSTPTQGKPRRDPVKRREKRALERAIRQGRRPKGATG